MKERATLLTKRWYDRRGRVTFEYWVKLDEGSGRITIDNDKAVFFAEPQFEVRSDARREVELQDMKGRDVVAHYFASQRRLEDERDRLLDVEAYLPLEADIKPQDRYLMERFITGAMYIEGESQTKNGCRMWTNPKLTPCEEPHKLKAMAFDIETEGLDGQVISIAGYCEGVGKVFMTHSDKFDSFVSCESERDTIEKFVEWMQGVDPDVLTGWNVIGFDVRVLIERARINGFELRLGRGYGRTSVRDSRMRGGMMADVEGRIVLDGRRTLQASGYYAERYGLEYTARTLLGEGKHIQKTDDPAAEIMRMHREEPESLADYNLQDCVLVDRIFKKQDLIGFVTERQQLTGLALDRIGGSVAAFDYLYLPRFHRKGYVARTIDSRIPAEASPGGWVMDAKPGLFRNVLVLDFKSLYPSIIRTFKVDPYAMIVADKDEKAVEGFRGASFHSEDHILPGLIQDLWQARDQAKKRGDGARSSAIKVLMNSFYGVLGTTGCRFFSSKLASSITMRGHEIIKASRDLINAMGYEVIYGDTDSLFVRIGEEHDVESSAKIGAEISKAVNDHWKRYCMSNYDIDSFLEFEFESHFMQLYMPTKRGSSEGSKKRYAGLVAKKGEPELVIKGLEAARTDWTPMARMFQTELFRRVFDGELDGLREWVQAEVRAIRQGQRDEELIYTKRLRRPAEEYKKNVPPHARAAQILGKSPRRISYYITTAGPQPVEMVDAPIDYEHYVERQLQPAAEGILAEIGIDFGAIARKQLSLF